MLTVSELFIYPIKSLGGVAVSSAIVTDRGFKYDRRWMLVDKQNGFITQRSFPQMALLQVAITATGLQVQHKITGDFIEIPFVPASTATAMVQIWDDTCPAQFVSDMADLWFSKILSMPCRLVFMPDTSKRKVEEDYARNNEITSLSDGYPFLLIGQSSLDDLNSRLAEPLPINRFRPNIVFTGGQAFIEDFLKHFTLNGIHFYGVKLCERCKVTTINQDNGSIAKEPLKTLASYRKKNNHIYFGQNLLHQGEGMVQVGDEIMVQELANTPWIVD